MASNQDGEKFIREWWGGISDDKYDQVFNEFAISKHFDTISSPNRLIPFRNMEANEDTSIKIKDFALVGSKFYGLGRNAADTKNKIYEKTGGVIDGTWTASTGGEATGTTSAIRTMFTQYHDDLYLFQSDTTVAQYDIGGTAYTDAFGTLGVAATSSTQGFVHPIADRLFIGYNNRIAQVDGSTFTDAVLVLPESVVVTSFCAWGDSLAIACRPKISGSGFASRVYLWNMIDSTPYEMIEWGEEDLYIIENVDNQIVGISINGVSSVFFRQILFGKSWSGGDVINFRTIDLGDNSSLTYTLAPRRQLLAGRVYFTLTCTSDTAPFTGIWVLGRKNEQYPFQMTVAYLVNNDSATTGATAFYKIGDYMFVAFGTGNVYRTSSTATFTATSLVETQVYDAGDTSRLKKLTGVALTYPVLRDTASVVLKYKKDEESSFTTIVTDTTDNTMASIVTAIAVSTSLPQFYQIQFRVESTGGGEIMQLRFKYDVVGSPMD